mmetsp:Transcript_30445/g.78984  ORF Transcript_30445/g.78984 Transcript_30445/m.78984 type:complete len:88 (-) Transcript_30445:792-1055(-)
MSRAMRLPWPSTTFSQSSQAAEQNGLVGTRKLSRAVRNGAFKRFVACSSEQRDGQPLSSWHACEHAITISVGHPLTAICYALLRAAG